MVTAHPVANPKREPRQGGMPGLRAGSHGWGIVSGRLTHQKQHALTEGSSFSRRAGLCRLAHERRVCRS